MEVGVKTHTAMCQTHICDLARLVWHKAPAEEGKKTTIKSRQTDQAPCSTHFIWHFSKEAERWDFGLLCPSRGRESGFFAHGGVLGGSAGAHADTCVPLYGVSGTAGRSQLILLPVVKQIIVLKQLGQTIASLMAQLKHGRDRNHNIFLISFPSLPGNSFLMTAVGFHFCSCF